MAKSSEKMTVEFKIDDSRVIDQKSQSLRNQDTSDQISRVMSEASQKVHSVDDMINFTQFVTQRVPSPSVSEVTYHSVDCGCMCHAKKHAVETTNEKIQVDSRFLNVPLGKSDDEESQSEKSDSQMMEPDGESQTVKLASEPEMKLMTKESAQLLKQMYSDLNEPPKKSCRCFEKYAKDKNLTDLKDLPSCETIANEKIKSNWSFDSTEIQSPATLNAISHVEVVTKVEPILLNKATSANDIENDCLGKCTIHCDMDCISHKSISSKKDKKKKDGKNNFVDVDLSGQEEVKSGNDKQRESFIKRFSGSFMKRSK